MLRRFISATSRPRNASQACSKSSGEGSETPGRICRTSSVSTVLMGAPTRGDPTDSGGGVKSIELGQPLES